MPDPVTNPAVPPVPPAPRARGMAVAPLLRMAALAALGLALLLAVAVMVLDSSLGHRLVTDRIAALKLQSGLVITIGRIDGSLFTGAQLHDVVLSDPAGRFMNVPDVDLDWRPMASWRLLFDASGRSGGGLDIRNLALHRGLLLRAPHLNPGDPRAPILPDFDIRLDRLAVDGLTVAPGLAGARRRIDLTAHALVHQGRVVLSCDGRLGGRDKLSLHLDSAPDRDRFALDLDYRAPAGGLLSGLTGIRRSVLAQIGGAGRFSGWHGWLLASADGRRVAGGLIDLAAGQYRVAALLRPAGAFTGPLSANLPAQLLGDRLAVTYAGTFANSVIDGRYHLANAMASLDATGAIDLARNRADGVTATLRLVRPEFLPAQWRAVVQPGPGVLTAQIDGAFADLAIRHDLALTRLATTGARFDGLHTAGLAHWHDGRVDVPLNASVVRVDTATPWLDQRLNGARLTGGLRLVGTHLSGDGWRVTGKGLTGNLALKSDLWRGDVALAGRVDAHQVMVPQLGVVDMTAKGVVATGAGVPWTLAVNYAGTLGHFANAGLVNVAGDSARVSGSLHWGALRALDLPDMRIVSNRVTLLAKASLAHDGRFTLTTNGRHADYGAFTAAANIDRNATHATALFENPVPAIGVKALALVLDSTPGGYRLGATGDSRLGPIVATVDFAVPAGTADPTRVMLSDVRVYDTRLTGALTLGSAGLDGDLTLAGGGLDGSIHLAAGPDGQAIDSTINARAARFGGDRPIAVALATLTAKARFSRANTTIDAALQAQGVGVGGLFIGRLLANATVVNGSGSITASMAGRRGSQLALQGTAAFTPDRVIAFVAGDYAGNAITMPRRAIANRTADGWQLEPSQINFGSGAIIASGRFGSGGLNADVGASEWHVAVSRMPLSALDIIYADLGLGGFASGVIDYRNDHSGAPQGHAELSVLGLTRSGLVLTSRPLDLAVVAGLDAAALQLRAVAREGPGAAGGGGPRMRLQALVTDLPRGGTLIERLRGGALKGQLRYAGPADALWRLAAIDAFDLTGPIGVAADMSGSIDRPVLTGAVVSHALRAQSAISGSDIRGVDLVGTFNGARLSLAHVSGTTSGNGRIAGSGTIDFSDASSALPKIDLRLGATNAELINRPDMAATITGPMRIVSDGHGGTVAGRLHIDKARYVLGRTSASQSLPVIAVTERNLAADVAPPPARGVPWKLLIDATGANRIDVRGMGLESEWQADVRVRGDTTNPQVFGSADVIRGSYEFAGKRFDLTRGRIRFNGEMPIDPQLDIVANGDANDISATISIGGSALRPQITFASVPSLPEEELLSRLLFGSSIAQISAPEAVQLAAALAALRGGGGLDPINKLRGAIGLDRLRVLSADPTIGRGTALAVGKYLGRKFYIELVTDGHGYSASSIEFRLTRWLSLLGTISTVYDESISLKYSKDY
ncbi:translocation/assembly module TamB domain-containing protein [Novosphingobium sp.]|uniref:translocation/assembly module TamB domain-containing protein n=1 Tax=Novosphingobium sp. TaxID=1874826 RepID=UPI00334264B2